MNIEQRQMLAVLQASPKITALEFFTRVARLNGMDDPEIIAKCLCYDFGIDPALIIERGEHYRPAITIAV